MSRRHRFDKGASEQFLVAVRAGARDEAAADHAGVPIETVREWLLGTTAQTAAFKKAVDKARADLELLAIGVVRREVVDDKSAAMWMAERVAADRELDRLRRLTTDAGT
jgi:hypothetical protein